MSDSGPRNTLAEILSYVVNGAATLPNVTASVLMLLICAATLGGLVPEIASGQFGPALSGFVTAIGTGLFASAIDRVTGKQKKGEPLRQDDIKPLLDAIQTSGLDGRLSETDFQREMRFLFAKLDLMTELIILVPDQTVDLVIQAMNTHIDLFTVRVIEAIQETAAQNTAQFGQVLGKLDELLKRGIEKQGARETPREAIPPARHIFISYAHADGEAFAQRLHDALEADGIGAWLDRYDIPPGAEWDSVIAQAIEDCRLFVFVVTPHSVESRVCKNEYTLAFSTKKSIIPLICREATLPLQLNALNWIDCREDFAQSLARLRQRIRDLHATPIPPEQIKAQEERALAVAIKPAKPAWAIRSKLINALPQDVSGRFKDRAKQQAAVVNLLMEPNTPLISIYGRAGVGKTALVCKVLDDLQKAIDGSCPDGIVCLRETRRDVTDTGISVERIFTDFGKLLSGDPKEAVDAAWRDPSRPLGQKVTTLLDALRDGRYILLLDNLESLQDPATYALIDPDLGAFFEIALQRPNTLRILVTSRDPLALARELKVRERVVPLETGLPVDDAVDLLRAFDPDGAAGLRDAPVDKLKVIATKTHGYPRALEAIAGLLLSDPLISPDDLLTKGTLLAAEITPVIVQKAIARLGADAVQVMEGLALFARPVTQAALEFLLAPYVETGRLHEVLSRLVRSYFAGFNKATGTYVLHPLDQEYCAGRIPEGARGDAPPVYTRYALLDRAADFYRRQRKPRAMWKSVEDLEPQLAEFEYCVQAGDFDSAAQLLRDFDFDCLFLWGQYARMIAMHERLQGKITNDRLTGNSVGSLGIAYSALGQVEKAIGYYEQALTLARKIGDRSGEGSWLGDLGNAYRDLGQVEKAIGYYQQALSRARKIGDRSGEGTWLGNLGNAYRDLGQVEQAIGYYQQALSLAQNIGDRRNEGTWLGNLGNAYRDLGQVEQAIGYYQQALTRAQNIGDRRNERTWLGNLGNAYRDLGQVEQAIGYCEQALALAQEIGDRRGEGIHLSNLGQAQAAIGRYTEAAQNLRRALTIGDEINDPRGNNYHSGSLALTLLLSGDSGEALMEILKACAFDVPENNHAIAVLHGLILTQLGKKGEAHVAFEEALRHAAIILSKTPNYYEAIYARRLAQAGLALVVGADLQPAIDSYNAARDICTAAGIVAEQLRLLDELMKCEGGEVLAPARAVLAGKG